MTTNFDWNYIRTDANGKILLLYRHERIFTEGLVKSGMKVMDVGGWGHLTERYIQEGADCTVLDLFTSDQYYPDRVKEHKFIAGDICDPLTVANLLNTFDIVSCFETLEHVSDQNLAVYNISTTLKPSGIFVGTVPIPGHCHYIGEPGIQFLNEHQLRNLLHNNGFVNIFIEPTGSTTLTEVPSSLYFRGVKNG